MDRVTANLPARDLAATAEFYGRLGFEAVFADDGWMILVRGELEIEFFPYPDVDRWSSNFSACVRVGDPDALYREWSAVGLPTDHRSIPRITGFTRPDGAPRMFALVDLDGSLLRVMADPPD